MHLNLLDLPYMQMEIKKTSNTYQLGGPPSIV